MSEDLQKRYSTLLKRRDEISNQKVRVETQKETSEKQRDELLLTLQNDFSVSSLDEAKNLLRDMESDVISRLDSLEKSLGIRK